MPAERIAMRQVRDVLWLKAAGVSGNEIARRAGVAPSTVRLTLKRLAVAGLGWPLPAEMTDAALEAQLFAAVGTKQGHRRRAEPDWAAVHQPLPDVGRADDIAQAALFPASDASRMVTRRIGRSSLSCRSNSPIAALSSARLQKRRWRGRSSSLSSARRVTRESR
jgi:hypothetical protein